MFVLDVSIALSWFFIDETTKETTALLDKLITETAFVPAHFSLELTNVLIGALHKKRITYAQILEFISLIEELNIQVDYETPKRGFHDILTLAHTEKLTSYDAAYLELAIRLGAPFATKDNKLKEAAKKMGIELVIM